MIRPSFPPPGGGADLRVGAGLCQANEFHTKSAFADWSVAGQCHAGTDPRVRPASPQGLLGEVRAPSERRGRPRGLAIVDVSPFRNSEFPDTGPVSGRHPPRVYRGCGSPGERRARRPASIHDRTRSYSSELRASRTSSSRPHRSVLPRTVHFRSDGEPLDCRARGGRPRAAASPPAPRTSPHADLKPHVDSPRCTRVSLVHRRCPPPWRGP